MNEQGPGEFFIDNFFLGFIGNDLYPEEYIELGIPMYYIYTPEHNDPYVDSIDMKYRYVQITTETITTSLFMGFSLVGTLSVSGSTPLSQVITLSQTQQYEKSTAGEDLVVFNLIEADKRDITFYFPGEDPETGFTDITGWYSFDILDQTITCYTFNHFETDFGVPPDFNYCKNQASKTGELLFKATGGPMTDWEEVGQRQLDLSSSYSIGLFLGIPLGKYVKFNLGLLFTFSYNYYLETETSLGVRWASNAPQGHIVQTDIYAPPEGSYSTPLDLPPYSAKQVTYIPPSVVTGFSATGGQGVVSLSWNPVSDYSFAYYQIYRNGVPIKKIYNKNANSYKDSGLADSTTYTYRISVFNSIDEEGPRSTASATTKSPSPGFTETILITTLAIGVIIVIYKFNKKVKQPIQPK
jgi:hypothetical protein